MILLDTDHFSVLRHKRHSSHQTLVRRLRGAFDNDIATTIVSVEEQMRGWMAAINRVRAFELQLDAYQRLHQLINLLSNWKIVPADDDAVAGFNRLKSQRIRIGTQDMKIAAIALAHDALLLTANQVDFEKVPGLRIENWLVTEGA
jgi:tRNA(fMet)-specific endonuclease VapC